MRRSFAPTMAPRRTVCRCATTAAPVREEVGRRDVGPSSQYVRRRNERDDDDNEFLRPNKVAILNKVKNHSDRNNFNRKILFKSRYHDGNQFNKSWHGKTDMARKRLNGELPYRNKQFFKNRSWTSTLPKKNYSYGNGNFRNSSWVLKESYTGWYTVQISNVEDSDEVFKVIKHHIAPVQLYPYNIRFFNSTNKLTFVIDDFRTAKILLTTNGKLVLHKQKIGIRVHHFTSHVPYVSVSSEVREKMALEIATRYNPHTKYLDLSHFHSCQCVLTFTENKLFLPLNQPLFLMAALKIVAEYVKHDLNGLSLKNNHIYLSEGLVWIRRLFPDLKVLDLSDNKLTKLKLLESLTGFTIEELNLSMNPVVNTENKDYYKQEILNMFPVLKKLDNSELESRYCVIAELQLKMPINRGNSFPIPEGHDPSEPNPVINFVELFLTQYFERYDDRESRELVGEAYYDKSIFTLSSDKLLNLYDCNSSKYMANSQNLLSTPKNCTKRILHRGRENILNFFEKLPMTKHDFGSFQIDVPIANSTLVQVIVNGVFAENFEESNHRHMFRSFCRVFCLVPDESGWHILSDMLFITVVSNELMIESLKRFNALKSLNKNNFNGNKTNDMVLFKEDEENMSHVESSSFNYPSSYQEAMFPNSINSKKTSFYQVPEFLKNQQTNTQPGETPTAALTSLLKQHEPNSMSTPILNSTQSSPLTSFSSPICLSSPASPINNTQSAAMTFQCNQLKPNDTSIQVLNITELPPCKTLTTSSILMNSPSSPTISDLDKLTMIKKFSNETRMRDRWATKCLKENGWDYSKAFISFSRLKSSIPSVAFMTN